MRKWSDDRAFDFGLVYSMKLYMHINGIYFRQ